jgi:hypothetical protein
MGHVDLQGQAGVTGDQQAMREKQMKTDNIRIRDPFVVPAEGPIVLSGRRTRTAGRKTKEKEKETK